MNDEALAAELKAEADGLDDEAALENAQRLMRLAAERLLELEKYAEPESELAYKIGRDSVLKAIRDIIAPHIQPGKINPDIDLVFAEIRRLESAQRWRPIEDAPREGIFLVAYDDGTVDLHNANVQEMEWKPYTGPRRGIALPTHFRPLPSPPQKEGER